MNTVLFVNASIGLSENLLLVLSDNRVFYPVKHFFRVESTFSGSSMAGLTLVVQTDKIGI